MKIDGQKTNLLSLILYGSLDSSKNSVNRLTLKNVEKKLFLIQPRKFVLQKFPQVNVPEVNV